MKRTNIRRKEKLFFYICVEGECELWYFQHLQSLINQCRDAKYLVEFQIKKERSQKSFMKSYNPIRPVFCVWDLEGTTNEDKNNLNRMFDEIIHTGVIPGYTHLSFELWIILHRGEMPGAKNKKKAYLSDINRLYEEHFESMKIYKTERNFKNILSKITLNDVEMAVGRGIRIREQNKQNHSSKVQKGKYEIYTENPDLLLHECVGKILKDCGILIVPF